ncbi:MAG: PQQ-like beta-propeller repeat protein [Polyangiaceae bacterium]|nr:PQQ-like beta-propeller repeat protein [Polyangiaceae bacterium]
MSPVHLVLRSSPSSSSSSAPLRGILDIIVDGVNLTARAGRSQGLTLLAELGHALGSLLRGRVSRTTAQLAAEGDTWELGMEVDGSDVLLSVYRSGPCPEVAVTDRRVSLVDLREGVEEALIDALEGRLPVGHRGVLESSLEQLRRGVRTAKPLSRGLVQDRIVVAPGPELSLRADAAFRIGNAATPLPAQVERADLHGLLLTGRLKIAGGQQEIELPDCQLFLVAERLVWLAEDTLESWQAARPLFRRLNVEGCRFGVRRGPGDGPVTFTVSTLSEAGAPEDVMTIAELEPTLFVETVAEFAEALCQRFCKHDGRQEQNLRLKLLLENAAILRDRLAEMKMDDSLTNAEPESFKSYGLPQRSSQSNGAWSQGGALRFSPRWLAAVPQIDLKATFLYQEKLIVGSAREVAALDSRTGDMCWRIQSERAATVATPLGIARLHADGRLRLHDLESGEVRSMTRLTPRAGGGAAGALVNTPGLPRLLLVAEGDRSITAIDLATGDIRWRHRGSRPSQFRMRRAGRLVLITGGDSALTALDVTTGDVVWKVRDRLPFSGDIAVTQDSAFALSISAVGAARLHHIDLWTGERRWTSYLEEQPVMGLNPMIAQNAVMVPTHDRRGVGIQGFGANDGKLLWEHEPGLSAASTAWLALDDRIVANSAAGTLICLDASTGTTLFNHVFARQVEADQPRRLEPILNNGALFVPQNQVEVIRPEDGELIGSVPCDLVPDLVRIDQNSNIIIAEDSGHLVSYSAAPQLRLIKSPR